MGQVSDEDLVREYQGAHVVVNEARACADRLFSPEATFSKLAAILATARSVA